MPVSIKELSKKAGCIYQVITDFLEAHMNNFYTTAEISKATNFTLEQVRNALTTAKNLDLVQSERYNGSNVWGFKR